MPRLQRAVLYAAQLARIQRAETAAGPTKCTLGAGSSLAHPSFCCCQSCAAPNSAPMHPASCACQSCAAKNVLLHPASCNCLSCASSSATLAVRQGGLSAATMAAKSLAIMQPLPLQQVRSMACSAGLGRPPPNVITIEYDPEDLETFIKVADAIEEAFPTVVVNGNESEDGRPGSFEIQTDDGISIYSRLSVDAMLPRPDDVISRITNRSQLPTAGDRENQPFCQ